MKTKLLLTFLFTAFTFSCFSQKEWAPIGATWHYNINDIVEFGYLKIESKKDTLVEGKICKLLQSTTTVYAVPGIYHNQNLDALITYQDNNKIYVYQHNKFLLLYDFNPSVGDIWDVWGIWNIYNAWNTGFEKSDTVSCVTGRVIVDSIKSITMNNLELKSIYTSPYHNSTMQYSGVIIEGIGCLGYLLPISKCNQHIDSEYPGPIRCYNGSTFSYYWTNKDCEYITGIEQLSSETSAAVYPNPCSEYINISNKNEGLLEVRLYNLSGVLLFNENVSSNSNSIDVSKLSKGTYLLKIRSQTNSNAYKIQKI